MSKDPPKDIEIEVGNDTATAEDAIGINEPAPPPRKPYRVLAESGLFKNGTQYDQGSTVELTEQAAAAFIANGDVEEV